MLETFSRVDDAIDTNADLADAIVETGLASMGLSEAEGGQSPAWRNTATKTDLDKARSTLHQLYRDWSAEGQAERSACYDPVMLALAESFSAIAVNNANGVKILVPGAGLGRLVFELCVAGYHVEGNEISYHQLLTSSFILNHTTKQNEWALHPFALSFSNNRSRNDQLRKVMIPDVLPSSVQSRGSMSMTTGDFCILYQEEEYRNAFDAVVTLFFIDTAPNMIRYIETVKHCLRKGGIWVNVGPLLWHSTNVKTGSSKEDKGHGTIQGEARGIAEPGAFELCEDEVILLLMEFGFVMEKHVEESSATGYVQNSRSMLQSVYKPSHWVAKLV